MSEPNYEIVQIVDAEGWYQVFLETDAEQVDAYTPNGYGVTLHRVAVWAMLHDREDGEVVVSGLTSGYGSLLGDEYGSMPERVVGFVGYVAPGQPLAQMQEAIETVAREEGVVGDPWVKRPS